MADTTSRLTSLKARITKLADMAGSDREGEARGLAAELSSELDRLMAETPAPSGGEPDRQRPPPKAPRDDVERCPVCSLRSFHFQKGSIRESADGGFEAFYRCGSCAHEGWREIP
ncbi:MAG: hypothetical protein IBX53_01000 [Halomonas sp.]|uniref:hypothetical protein n=1 Tax=Halomonas sp. TaxID=1486246 RepID=UPI0019FC0966|nr:hypothetical protein [Halomonas sp.]MBE0487628.1 hypothetical protein [Halomonas sp.]